jgi:hypothetical protein
MVVTENQPDLPPAGWHDDPESVAGQRYWDGSAWTDERRVVGGSGRAWTGGRIGFLILGCVLALGLGGLSGLSSSETPAVDAILPVILVAVGIGTAWRAIASK